MWLALPWNGSTRTPVQLPPTFGSRIGTVWPGPREGTYLPLTQYYRSPDPEGSHDTCCLLPGPVPFRCSAPLPLFTFHCSDDRNIVDGLILFLQAVEARIIALGQHLSTAYTMAPVPGPISVEASRIRRHLRDLCKNIAAKTESGTVPDGVDANSKYLADCFDRFNIWAGSLGVLQKGDASLDARLSNHILAREVLRLLKQLDTVLSDRKCSLSSATLARSSTALTCSSGYYRWQAGAGYLDQVVAAHLDR